MKTPREVLFERHQSAQPKLDAVRQEALTALGESSAEVRPRGSVSGPCAPKWTSERRPAPARMCGVREFLLSFRWHLAGMSAVWLLVVLLNRDHSPALAQNIVKENIPSPQRLLASLRENRRQLLELIEAPVIEPAPVPPRRSELQAASLMA